MVKYKQRCARCKKNYVLVTTRNRYSVCHECQKKELSGEITDPDMKKFFDLPSEYYEQNQFLRNIKIAYLRYGSLTERQVSAFKEAVERIKNEAK